MKIPVNLGKDSYDIVLSREMCIRDSGCTLYRILTVHVAERRQDQR